MTEKKTMTKARAKAAMLEHLMYIADIANGLHDDIEDDDFSLVTFDGIEELSDRIHQVDELFTEWEDAKE